MTRPRVDVVSEQAVKLLAKLQTFMKKLMLIILENITYLNKVTIYYFLPLSLPSPPPLPTTTILAILY